MEFTRWYLVIGGMLVMLVFFGAHVKRLPITSAMLYLAVGWTLGKAGWIDLDALRHSKWMEHLSELAVIVSLFTAGLKLRVPLRDRRWRLPVGLAFVSMAVTVGLIALLGIVWLGLPLGAAVVLGAVLAPTDPVLASDVQVEHPRDPERLRFSLTGEAGLNDGTAFPFVMLGLGLLGLHEMGPGGIQWWAVDVIWATAGGLGIGAALGMGVGRLVIHMRRTHEETMGLDDFLALGLICLAYGLALLLHTYGFLAVFASGLALRRVEHRLSGEEAPPDVKAIAAGEKELARHPELAPAVMTTAVLQFNEQIERIAELALVVVMGALLPQVSFSWDYLMFGLVLFLIIRPLATAPLSLGGGMNGRQSALVSWFGVRGIGSIYYLYYAVNKGMPESQSALLIPLTLTLISFSICVHGMSVTPLMRWYERHKPRKE